MEVVIVQCPEDVGRIVADEIQSLVSHKGDAVLGLATGASPLPAYREVVRRQRARQLDLRDVRIFLLDEYVGVPGQHQDSYRSFIRRELLDPAAVPERHLHVPDGCASDLRTECQRYEDAIRAAGGIDLQLLGIGRDGHVGFNEPGSSLSSRTRVKTLTPTTREDNSRFLAPGGSTPVHALTMGLGSILEASALLLIATGTAKARAVAQAVEGPLTARCPASIVQLHPHAKVVLDRDAASCLELGAYYRDVQELKGALSDHE